jgi:Pyridoxamine 5'-phosphate oxidase
MSSSQQVHLIPQSPGDPIVEVMPRTGRGTAAANDAGNIQPLDWRTAIERFETGGWFWLSTVRPDGRPHTMPLFAAWSGASFFIASNAITLKSRNLDANGSCALTRDQRCPPHHRRKSPSSDR